MDTVKEEIETHDHDTLGKVYHALREVMGEQTAIDSISVMQNAGILFRERKFV